MKLKFLAATALIAFTLPAFAESVQMNDGDLSALDQDGDGSVSKSEYDKFTGYAFGKMDKDGSGSLSPDEVDDHVVGDAFSILDDDGDGMVSASEFSMQMDEDFAVADQDGDGMLN